VSAVFLALLAGCASDDDSGDAAGTTATTTAETEPAQSVPTPEVIKLEIFERAYSECASIPLADLAGKYKVAKKTKKAVAEGVGRGWVEVLEAGPDAIPEGRSGCLAGFDDTTAEN